MESDEKSEIDESPLWNFDSINAVWYSMLAAGCVESRGKEEYTKVYRAAMGMETKSLIGRNRSSHSDWINPVSLAQGLRTIDVWLGIIFRDDPHTIIWPLGKSLTSQGQEVMIYCCNTHDGCFSYQGMKLLSVGGRPVRPPRANHAFSNTSLDGWKSRLPSRRRHHSRDGERPSGPSSAHKPFPFLRLPAELRNKVYEEYLSDRNWDLEWTHRFEFDCSGIIQIPELCKTSHQLLSEVLPLYLAQGPLRIDSFEDRPLRLDAQPILHEFLKFRSFEFLKFSFDAGSDTSISEVEVTLSDDKLGFTIEYQPIGLVTDDPETSAMLQQLKMLIIILTEGMTTDGLRLADISAIWEFLTGCNKYKGKLTDTA